MGMIDEISALLRQGVNAANNVMQYGPSITSQIDAIKPNTKSIVRGAKDATFQFPCLISDTIPIDLANTLVRTLDRVYADLTQTWISMHPIMDMSLDPTPMSYLKRLHQNIRLESVQEDDGEIFEKCVEEAYNGEALLFMNKNKTYGMLINGADNASKAMLESHKEYLREYLSEYDIAPFAEADSDMTNAYDLANNIMDSRLNQIEKDKRKDNMLFTQKREAPKLLDRDVKKSNDITPYGIQVRLIAKNEKNEFFQYIDFIVGVKAVMHPIRSDEIITNIQRSIQNKSVVFKFLKWTTGEISLFKNIILNMDELKMDASNRNNRWFPTLRRLKKRKFGLHDITVPHGVVPNATLAISSYEADYLENNLSINIRDANVAKRVMNNLFLVAFVIIDEATGTLNILYDGDSAYQTYSLEMLERENTMSSNKLGREIGRMISH